MPKRFKIINIIKFIVKKILNYELDNWKIGITNKNLKNFNFNDIKFFEPNFAEYWADPFYVNFKKKEFIFFEKYSYIDGKGCISVGELVNSKLINIQDILVKNYHLSYPFIYKFKKNYYLIPETHENKRLEIYIAENFPFKWKLFKTALKGKTFVDPTLISIKNNLWLFVNESKNSQQKLNKNLNIYKLENFFTKNFIPHKKNPVIQNFIGGRNAGKIEKINGEIIRPSQLNKSNRYGYGLRISKITKIGINKYEENLIREIKPKKASKIKGIHHISIGKDKIIIDCNFK